MKKSVVKPAARSKKTTGKAKSVETKKSFGQKQELDKSLGKKMPHKCPVKKK
jgi:hypothetical protein